VPVRGGRSPVKVRRPRVLDVKYRDNPTGKTYDAGGVTLEVDFRNGFGSSRWSVRTAGTDASSVRSHTTGAEARAVLAGTVPGLPKGGSRAGRSATQPSRGPPESSRRQGKREFRDGLYIHRKTLVLKTQA
jgi:hypothetical protein